MKAEKQTPEAESVQANHPNVYRSKGLTRWLVVLVIVLLGIGAFVLDKQTKDATVNEAEVSINATGFFPATVNVHEGDTVTWVNGVAESEAQLASDPYPLNNSFSAFNQEDTLSQGDTYSFTFEKAGKYAYHDSKTPEHSGYVIVTSK